MLELDRYVATFCGTLLLSIIAEIRVSAVFRTPLRVKLLASLIEKVGNPKS